MKFIETKCVCIMNCSEVHYRTNRRSSAQGIHYRTSILFPSSSSSSPSH